jgi:hypothetical protein
MYATAPQILRLARPVRAGVLLLPVRLLLPLAGSRCGSAARS